MARISPGIGENRPPMTTRPIPVPSPPTLEPMRNRTLLPIRRAGSPTGVPSAQAPFTPHIEPESDTPAAAAPTAQGSPLVGSRNETSPPAPPISRSAVSGDASARLKLRREGPIATSLISMRGTGKLKDSSQYTRSCCTYGRRSIGIQHHYSKSTTTRRNCFRSCYRCTRPDDADSP